MNSEGGGNYSYEFDMGDRSGSFTPLIYFEYDETISQLQFFDGSDFKDTDGIASVASVELTDATLEIVNQTSSANNTFVYNFLMYDAVGGSKTLGYEYNNCVEIKINGETYLEELEGCSNAVSVGQTFFNFTFEPNKRYHVELKYKQVSPTSNLKFGERTVSGGIRNLEDESDSNKRNLQTYTITSLTAGNTKRPLVLFNLHRLLDLEILNHLLSQIFPLLL